MADFDSSLPVRTQTNGDVIAFIADGTISTQLLNIDVNGRVTNKLNDGSGNAVTSQVNGAQRALDIGVNVSGVQIDPRQIRALLSGTDSVAAIQGTPAAVGNAWPVKPTDGTNSQAFTSAGHNLVNVFDSSGTAISSTNPLPVTISSISLGTQVNNYNTVVALAGSATSNHDYTITTSKTFLGRMFYASASGKIRVEIQISADGTTFVTKFVAFNSTANPNIEISLDNLCIPESGTGSKIRIIRKNSELFAQDVFSTICGTES